MSNLTTSSIDTLTTEILMLKQQTAQNIIEIGKRLTQVKESLGHGEWGKYLEEKVEFSHKTANRFMQVARECSNSSTLTNLTQSKLWTLLDLPQDQREEFISTPQALPTGETKTVDEMTTRELQLAIKAKKEAESRIENLAEQLENTTEENELLRQENLKLSNKPAEIIVQEKIVETIPDDYKQLKKDLKEKNDELLTLTRSQVVKKNRQMVRDTLSYLVQDLGKHLKRAEMEFKMIPYDEETEEDIESCISVLENAVYEMKKWIKGDVIHGEITIDI